MNHNTLILILLGTAITPSLEAQSVYRVSPRFDSVKGTSAAPFPGLHGAFRQQILIEEARLANLKGKDILGLSVRRDLFDLEKLTGGLVDYELRVSNARVAPAQANATFASNAPASSAVAFRGRITVPTSPALKSSPQPWSSLNSIRIALTKPFRYSGGNLCIDVMGRPAAGQEPRFWFVGQENGSYTGKTRAFGSSCSAFADTNGHSHWASDNWLQIGSTMRLVSHGRPGSTPLLLLGAAEIPGGLDLSAIGATKCRQHIAYFLLTPLRYSTNVRNAGDPASLFFELQIPPDSALLGRSVFTQFADDESGLPRANRTNAAGLTTSNGLEITVSSIGPDLGMSTVTSNTVDGSAVFPSVGRVDVNRAPVLRLIY